MPDIIFSRFRSGEKDQHDESTVGVLFSGITQNKFYSSWDLMSTSFFINFWENSFFHHSLRYLFIFFAQWDFFRLDCDKSERMKNCIKKMRHISVFHEFMLEQTWKNFHRTSDLWLSSQRRLTHPIGIAAQRRRLTPRHSTHCHDICACKRH